jgi:hypothetical protein
MREIIEKLSREEENAKADELGDKLSRMIKGRVRKRLGEVYVEYLDQGDSLTFVWNDAKSKWQVSVDKTHYVPDDIKKIIQFIKKTGLE